MPTAISIRNITKSYPPLPGSAQMVAVDRVSLEIEPGELFFLLGPSGCGKTTLLRMIAGFIEPTDGQILFDGKDVTNTAPQHRNTGMVFQSYALWPHLSVEANVAFGLSIRKTPASEAAKRVSEALGSVHMLEHAKHKPNRLSGGQQQRVALARAMVVRPDVLLLDEPLSNLDAKLRLELRSEIRRICKASQITTVYVTHDQHEALSMADRIAIMRAGKVEQLDTPGKLYREPANQFVAGFLGEVNVAHGVVESVDNGLLRARLPWGVCEVQTGSAIQAGGKLSLGVRPESISVLPGDQSNPAATAETRLPAKVVEFTYLGSTSQVKVQLSDGSIWLAETDLSADALPVGQPVQVSFAAKSITCWRS